MKYLRVLEAWTLSTATIRLDYRHNSVITQQVTTKATLFLSGVDQRVTGRDNCAWTVNTTREDKSLFICPSSSRQKAIISQLPLNHREHIFHRQLGRRGEKQRVDKVELELEARVADLLLATMLSLAAFIWPQQSRPGRTKPSIAVPLQSSTRPLFPSDLRGPFCVGIIIVRAQTSKHKTQLSSPMTTARRGPSGFLWPLNLKKKKKKQYEKANNEINHWSTPIL